MRNPYPIHVIVLIVLIFASCTAPAAAPGAAPAAASSLEEQITKILAGDVLKFKIQAISPISLKTIVGGTTIKLPAVNQSGEIVDLDLSYTQINLRESGAVGYTKGRDDKNVQQLNLPEVLNFTLGDCSQKEKFVAGVKSCGSLTIMDGGEHGDQALMISAIIIHPEVGISFIEPVNLIIGGNTRSYENKHILYNIKDTTRIAFSDNEEPKTQNAVLPKVTGLAAPVLPSPLLVDAIAARTKIVLDGDVTFYNVDKQTVWARQEAAFNGVLAVYKILESLGGTPWSLDVAIKGQETWISGGPTTKNGDDLIKELLQPHCQSGQTSNCYLLLTNVEDTELHYLFVGYEVTGLYGKSAGIGTKDFIGGKAGYNHVFGPGRKEQSLKTRWIVMAHEVGHVLGGKHGDADTSGCPGGYLSSVQAFCGTSIMAGGESGGPETRAPYFSDKNDNNIITVLDGVLSAQKKEVPLP